jgi:hypothetical protein
MAGFRVIRPDALKTDAVRSEVRKAMHSIGIKAKKTFREITDNWKEENQPRYNFETVNLKHAIRLTVYISGNVKIFDYVSRGTDPHVIVPRNSKRLIFRTGYKAKTQPGSLKSGTSSYSGPKVAAKEVNHPGTKAREFEEQVAAMYESVFTVAVDEAVKRGAKATGHAMP